MTDMALKLSEGDVFPAFSLPDQDGKVWSDGDLRGTPSIVYFYPKDDTSGCTAEACGIRDQFPRFVNVRVFGVSPDSVKSHKKFAKKYDLPFTLLADESKELCESVGIWVEKSMYGKKYMGVERTTFLVGSDGKIQKIWSKVKPEGHEAEMLAAI